MNKQTITTKTRNVLLNIHQEYQFKKINFDREMSLFFLNPFPHLESSYSSKLNYYVLRLSLIIQLKKKKSSGMWTNAFCKSSLLCLRLFVSRYIFSCKDKLPYYCFMTAFMELLFLKDWILSVKLSGFVTETSWLYAIHILSVIKTSE